MYPNAMQAIAREKTADLLREATCARQARAAARAARRRGRTVQASARAGSAEPAHALAGVGR